MSSPNHAYSIICLSHNNYFFTDPCTENEVRLNDDVVEVCHSAQWGLVCAHSGSYFTPAAEVVCRQVGIPSRSQFVCGFQHEHNIGYVVMCR